MCQRHLNRRNAARKLVDAGRGPRADLTHPIFNLREVVKQMVLLEDHLFHPYKLCPDCVRKHLLTIEAFAEEAATLDKTGIYRDAGEGIAEQARQWIESFEDGDSPQRMGQSVRKWRKDLAAICVDPRTVVDRVASTWQQRGFCPHRLAALRTP